MNIEKLHSLEEPPLLVRERFNPTSIDSFKNKTVEDLKRFECIKLIRECTNAGTFQLTMDTIQTPDNVVYSLKFRDILRIEGSITQLAQALLSPHCKVQTLYLNNCSLQFSLIEDLISILPLTRVKRLSLSSNRFGTQDFQNLILYLKGNSTLRALNLEGIRISEETLEELTNLLKCTNLKWILGHRWSIQSLSRVRAFEEPKILYRKTAKIANSLYLKNMRLFCRVYDLPAYHSKCLIKMIPKDLLRNLAEMLIGDLSAQRYRTGNCPKKHGLTKCIYRSPGFWYCDACAVRFNMDDLGYCCVACRYDECLNCHTNPRYYVCMAHI